VPPRPIPLLAGSLLAFVAGIGLAFTGAALMRSGDRRPPPSAPDLAVVQRAVVISRDGLPDAAMAVFDSVAPRIYLNPRLLARIGPELAAFLRAHEEGHLAYHHAPERRFGLIRIETPASVLHGWELDADCFAGRKLRRDYPVAVVAAIRFFQDRRGVVTDSDHPDMGVRALRLIDCLTDPAGWSPE
jgi:hypothetical protein